MTEKLGDLVPPPAKPIGLNRTWAAVERELGLLLPVEYKGFIDSYGTGLICGAGIDLGYLNIWNFRDTSSPLLEGIANVVREYEDARKKGHESPYPFYPASGGLLPFGSTPSGDYLNWRTSKKVWDTVFYCFDQAEMVTLEGHDFVRTITDLLTHNSPLFDNERLPKACFTSPFRFTAFNW